MYIYGWVHCHPSYLIRGGQQIFPSPPPPPPRVPIRSVFSPPTISFSPSKMDCSCGCLARMEPMLETCVFSEGLVLNHKQRHSALCSLLYSPFIGFRAPFVHQMTHIDVNDSWVCMIQRSLFVCAQPHLINAVVLVSDETYFFAAAVVNCFHIDFYIMKISAEFSF